METYYEIETLHNGKLVKNVEAVFMNDNWYAVNNLEKPALPAGKTQVSYRIGMDNITVRLVKKERAPKEWGGF